VRDQLCAIKDARSTVRDQLCAINRPRTRFEVKRRQLLLLGLAAVNIKEGILD
jgi:hypothetical protein